jgi:hypothetical protein
MELNFSVSSGCFLNSEPSVYVPIQCSWYLPLVCSANLFRPTMFSFWFSTSSSAVVSSDFCSSDRLISFDQLRDSEESSLPFHVESAAEKFCSAILPRSIGRELSE